MLDGVGGFRVVVEARHHKLPRKMVSHDFVREREAKNVQVARIHIVMTLLAFPFDVLLNQLSDVLDARNLQDLVWFRGLRMFGVAGNVGPITLLLVSARMELLGRSDV